uniref:PHD finger protein ALFIN-LIKE n=1 Tax=Oryza rufipogon TaxID=4529 RepID=A0A0E0PHY7_ORYRU
MDASYRRDGRGGGGGGGGGGSAPRSVEDIFKDFRARRTAILRALTHDVEDFYAQCDPEKENLCLYGYANEAKRLFGMMNDLPTVYEVVSGSRQSKERDRSGMDNSSRNKISSKHTSDVARVENNIKEEDEGYDEDDGDHSETLCGTCGGIYSADEFWIGCDVCERWYHGKCVKITPAKAESIKQYKCPSCSSKRPRQ